VQKHDLNSPALHITNPNQHECPGTLTLAILVGVHCRRVGHAYLAYLADILKCVTPRSGTREITEVSRKTAFVIGVWVGWDRGVYLRVMELSENSGD